MSEFTHPDISRDYGPQNAARIAAALGRPTPVQAAPKPSVEPYTPPGDVLVLTPPVDEKARRRSAQIEWQEQVHYFSKVNQAVLDGRDGADMIYAVTNSNVAGKAIGGKLVAAGLRAGYPDINIDVPMVNALGIQWHGARIELKTPQGSPSDVGQKQREWHERLNARGYSTVVCYGWREAWAYTRHYLGWGDCE